MHIEHVLLHGTAGGDGAQDAQLYLSFDIPSPFRLSLCVEAAVAFRRNRRRSGKWKGGECPPETRPRMWPHYARVTGKSVA